MRLVAPIARRIRRNLPPCFPLDDLISAGYLGLLDAATRFNAALRVPFAAYASRRIQGAMLDSIRRREWRESANDPMDDYTYTIRDTTLIDADEIAEKNQLVGRLREAVDLLDPRDRQLLELYYSRARQPAAYLPTEALSRLRGKLANEADRRALDRHIVKVFLAVAS